MREDGKTGETKLPKVDRRTLYTRKAVKDALLELLRREGYSKVTVASLCREAEITRTTFYAHYAGIHEVVDELVDEALMVAEAAAGGLSTKERMDELKLILARDDWSSLRDRECVLGPCQRVADDPRYRVVFTDPELSDYVLHRIYISEKDAFIEYLTGDAGLSPAEADRIFTTMVYGTFYVNRSMNFEKNEEWYRMQLLVNRMFFDGVESIRDENAGRKATG